MKDGKCGCMHHKIVPLLVVVFGLLFLLGSMGKVAMATVSTWWPVLVILAGLMKLFRGMCSCCNEH